MYFVDSLPMSTYDEKHAGVHLPPRELVEAVQAWLHRLTRQVNVQDIKRHSYPELSTFFDVLYEIAEGECPSAFAGHSSDRQRVFEVLNRNGAFCLLRKASAFYVRDFSMAACLADAASDYTQNVYRAEMQKSIHDMIVEYIRGLDKSKSDEIFSGP